MGVQVLVIIRTGYAVYFLAFLIAQFADNAFFRTFSLVVDTRDIPSLNGALRYSDICAQDGNSDDSEENIEIHKIENLLLLLSSH